MGNKKIEQREKVVNTALKRYKEGLSNEEERKILIEAMKRYRDEVDKSGKGIYYNALVLGYFADEPQTISQMAARLLCTRRTVFKYLASGKQSLSPHIFGIGGIDLGAQDEMSDETEERKRQYKNTKQLLENYRTFKKFTQGIDLEALPTDHTPSEILEEADSFILPDSELTPEIIRQSQARTGCILDYIDNVIREYRSGCGRAGTEDKRRRYRIIAAYYFDPEALSIEQLMEREQLKERAVYKDIQKATGQLAGRIYSPRQHDPSKKGGEEDDILSNCAI
ncbi:MAG: hypothetical protein ACOYKD_10430 [Anaerolineaceae bacterium]|jgi:hypothetical protein